MAPVVVDATEILGRCEVNDGVDVLETGVIVGIVDSGTIAQVFIETSDGLLMLAADANRLWRAEADCGSLRGSRVQFGRTDWPGGLAWLSPLDLDEEGR